MESNYELGLDNGSREVLHGSDSTVDTIDDPYELYDFDDDSSEEKKDEKILPKEEYDYNIVNKIGELNGMFKLDDMEEELFMGEYETKFIENKLHASIDPWIMVENIRCQLIYRRGRVLYKSVLEDGVDIFELINVFIRYTHDPCDDLELDKSVVKNKQMLGGTICPMRKHLFLYKNREFIAYGRYIFGYSRQHVKIINETNVIKMLNPPFYDDCYDYVYAFMIRNYSNSVVEAFGLYR